MATCSPNTRPPCSPPPSTHSTEPCPWSVPRLPFSRKVRPNSLITTTVVRPQASPISSARTARPWPNSSKRLASAPLAPPCATWVSPAHIDKADVVARLEQKGQATRHLLETAGAHGAPVGAFHLGLQALARLGLHLKTDR